MDNKKAKIKKILITAVSVVLAICLAFTVLMLTVQGFREKVWDFFADFSSPTHYSVNTSADENVKLLETYKGKYIPSYIPEGYKIDNIENGKQIYFIEMSNNGKYISISESDKDSVLGVDNEQVEKYEEISIKGETAIKAEKDGTFYLTMKKGESLIHIMTTDEELDLVGFAELIEEK